MLKTVGFPSTRTGDQTIVDGNLVIGTAGKGIDFSADPSAAGMTSELLDDYEEGTWTPNQGSGLTVTGAFSSTGTYTKIGRLVHVRGAIFAGTSVSCASVGVISSNLPFQPSADTAGTYFNGTLGAGGQIDAAANSGIYAVGAIAATSTIYFSAVYSV